MSTSKKIRAYAQAIAVKIHFNRFKTTKFPGGVNEKGERDWTIAPVGTLVDKLDEEVDELKNEVYTDTPLADALRNEAADVGAISMMLADRLDALPLHQTPTIICLCGSTKFKDAFVDMNKKLTLEGNIILTVGCFPHTDNGAAPEDLLGHDTKTMLDWLHKRKIDIADEIYVLNVGGYIGSSTRSEIEYAETIGKPVRYLEPLSQPEATHAA